MRNLGRVAVAASTLAVMGGLSACGVVDDIRYPYAGESAETVFVDAMNATTSAESIRVSGTLDPRAATPWAST